jgi:signal transduction histidine kinase
VTGRVRHRLHAARVAAVAAAVVTAFYAIAAVGLTLFVVHRLTAQTDARLEAAARAARADASPVSARPVAGGDPDDAPIFSWRVTDAGAPTALTLGAPALPSRHWVTGAGDLTLGHTQYRTEALASGSGWVVTAESTAQTARTRSLLILPEIGFGAAVAIATFLGAVVVGLRTAAPVELVRRRQAEFTADASHELRTPLSVIEAETDLALRRRRDPEQYEDALRRIRDEGRRLHRIVEDLLWLARADGTSAPTPQGLPVDLAAAALAAVERFRPVAVQGGVDLRSGTTPAGAAPVDVPEEWLERLVGVLVDNAIKYAGAGGRVEVSTTAGPNRVALRVDDSGPGIEPGERQAVFDRFHRATDGPGGSGLGLAIADSVVRLTGGAWHVGDAPLGGARMEVSWRRAAERGQADGQIPRRSDHDDLARPTAPTADAH